MRLSFLRRPDDSGRLNKLENTTSKTRARMSSDVISIRSSIVSTVSAQLNDPCACGQDESSSLSTRPDNRSFIYPTLSTNLQINCKSGSQSYAPGCTYYARRCLTIERMQIATVSLEDDFAYKAMTDDTSRQSSRADYRSRFAGSADRSIIGQGHLRRGNGSRGGTVRKKAGKKIR